MGWFGHSTSSALVGAGVGGGATGVVMGETGVVGETVGVTVKALL